MQVAEEQSRVKIEETIDDQYLVSDLRTVDNDVSRIQEVVDHSVSLKKRNELAEVISLALLQQSEFLSLTSYPDRSWNRHLEQKLSPLISLSTVLRLERIMSSTRRLLILCVQRQLFERS